MTILEQECMANKMSPVWVPVANGRYAAGLVDSTTPPTLYVFDKLQGVPGQLPYFGPISGPGKLSPSSIKQMRVVHAIAPVRYIAITDGKLAPGFFDPGFRIFFRWRGQVRSVEQMNFMPSNDPISPEVDRTRISAVLDIPMPADVDDTE
jgi:hypothetical protein